MRSLLLIAAVLPFAAAAGPSGPPGLQPTGPAYDGPDHCEESRGPLRVYSDELPPWYGGE